jgi:TolB protein
MEHMKKTAILLLSIGAMCGIFAAKFNLDLYASKFDSIPIAVLPFANKGAAVLDTNRPWQVIGDDLAFSGRFNVLRADKPDTAAYAANNVGVQIDGEYTLTGNTIVLDCFLRDAAAGEQIVGRKYQGDLKHLRTMAHRFANEMMEIMLGEKGYFTSLIVYVRDDGKNKNLWIMDYDGGNQRAITNAAGINIFPSFADSSSVIWTSFLRGKPDLYKGNIVTGRSEIFMYSRYVTTSPSVSTVDGRIVFASSRNGNMDIYVCEPDKSGLKQITFNKAVDTSPCWSPNGYQVAFCSDRAGSPQIYVMDADGANVKRLTFEGNYADSPAWSPKGDRIAYQMQTDWKFDIWTIGVNGANPVKVTTCPGSNEYPTWSPDGSHIAFSSGRGGAIDMCVVRADGTDLQRITKSGQAKMADWSHF